MHSFSDGREKLLQTRYITQSVVCAMMWQLAKQTASHQQRVQPDSYSPAGIVLARIWMEFSIIELPNPLKSVWHCKLPKRLSHSSSSQNRHHNLRRKGHLHWGLAKGLLKANPDGDRTANPQFWAVVHNHPHRGLNRRHLWSSDKFKHKCFI